MVGRIPFDFKRLKLSDNAERTNRREALSAEHSLFEIIAFRQAFVPSGRSSPGRMQRVFGLSITLQRGPILVECASSITFMNARGMGFRSCPLVEDRSRI